MSKPNSFPLHQEEHETLCLADGDRAVINGALMTARGACELEIDSTAFVLAGPALHHGANALRNPREELYFSMIHASTNSTRFVEERFRLFTLLSQIIAQEPSEEVQSECAKCSVALIVLDMEVAIRSASRLASQSLGYEFCDTGGFSKRVQEWRCTS